MEKMEFIKQLTEFCELDKDDITFDTLLKSLDGYDSMAIMSMIAFIHKNFNMSLTAKQVNELSDFNSLIEIIGKDKFEND